MDKMATIQMSITNNLQITVHISLTFFKMGFIL